MASVVRIFIVSVLAFLLNINSALSLNCYKCEGPLNKGLDCENNLSEVGNSPCDDGYSCGVYVKETTGQAIIYRNCYPQNHCDILKNQYANNPNVDITNCEICDSDSCNTARFSSANLVTASLSFTFLILLLIRL